MELFNLRECQFVFVILFLSGKKKIVDWIYLQKTYTVLITTLTPGTFILQNSF